MSGAERIAAERRRQIQVEDYTAEHDADHESGGQMAVAAWCYLGDLVDDGRDFAEAEEPPEWPWPTYGEGASWKPTPGDPILQLVKAGALIAAEIDRLLALRGDA